MSQERILDRVRKLLALANDEAATEGERDNALRMAHATLAKHQLDMLDVAAFERDKDDPRGRYDIEGWSIPWCRSVRSAVAKLFNCSYFYMKLNATRGRHSFVGRESNATTAMLMGDWIVKALLKEADKRYGHRLTPEGRSFGEGAAYKLHQRVNELLKGKASEYAATGYALALLDEDKLNEAWIADNVGKLGVAKRRTTGVDGDAWHSGSKHAEGISLNQQLGNKAGTKALR